MTLPVSPSPRSLIELETVIQRGLSTFVEVGAALIEIREGRKYREAGYATFEAYCLERWNITDRRARQLIGAAEVNRALADYNEYVAASRDLDAVMPIETGTVVPVLDPVTVEVPPFEPISSPLPTPHVHLPPVVAPVAAPATERQARELAPLYRKEGVQAVAEVLGELQEQHGEKITAELVRDAVARRVQRETRAAEKVVEAEPPRVSERLSPEDYAAYAKDVKEPGKAAMAVTWATGAAELLRAFVLIAEKEKLSPKMASLYHKAKQHLASWPKFPTLYDGTTKELISPDYRKRHALTSTEAVMMERLMEIPGALVGIEQLIESMYWIGCGTENTARKNINNLRDHLRRLGWDDGILRNERDMGWAINREIYMAAYEDYLNGLRQSEPFTPTLGAASA